jgi:hypothetical protein
VVAILDADKEGFQEVIVRLHKPLAVLREI